VDDLTASCPLKLYIDSLSIIEWNVKSTCGVNLSIQNLSFYNEVSFVVAPDWDSACQDTALGESTSTGTMRGFFWTGLDTSLAYTLAPQEVVDVSFEAYFPQPGLFNLNKFRFYLCKTSRTEGAPVFGFPFRKLCWVKDSQELVDAALKSRLSSIPQANYGPRRRLKR